MNWRLIILVAVALLLWAGALATILKGRDWQEAVFWAAMGTLLISTFQLPSKPRKADD